MEKKESKGNQKWMVRYQSISGFLTKCFNLLSFLTLTIGITLLILFINIEFNFMNDKELERRIQLERQREDELRRIEEQRRRKQLEREKA